MFEDKHIVFEWCKCHRTRHVVMEMVVVVIRDYLVHKKHSVIVFMYCHFFWQTFKSYGLKAEKQK